MFSKPTSITIQAMPDVVWKFLTDPTLVKMYFYDTNLEADWVVGGKILFKGEYEGKPYEDVGIITEITPQKSLSYNYRSSWSELPDEPENYVPINYLIEIVGPNQTKLTVTQYALTQQEADQSSKSWETNLTKMRDLIYQTGGDHSFFF